MKRPNLGDGGYFRAFRQPNVELFLNAECQVRYTIGALRWLAEDGLDALEVKPPIYDDYAARMDAALADFTWSHGSAGNWYKNTSGKVIAKSPWPLVQCWEWTRAPDDGEFVATSAHPPG